MISKENIVLTADGKRAARADIFYPKIIIRRWNKLLSGDIHFSPSFRVPAKVMFLVDLFYLSYI